MTASFAPIWAVDVIGSILMIVLSILCFRLARQLKRREPDNIMWTYLVLVCSALTIFAVSRSAGHILKQILLLTESRHIWASISPFSGAVNTFTFILVGGLTLFFERTWDINQKIIQDRRSLQNTHGELLYLNENLERLVTERTEELAMSEQKYRGIFEASRDMILVTSPDGRIIDMNPAGYQMLGFQNPGAGLQRVSFRDFFSSPEDCEGILSSINAKGFVSNIEMDLKHRDGRRIRSLISGSLDQGATERSSTIHFLVKDIEERRRIEEQIAQADKLASIGQLSAGIAHEINNPLGVILGYTQLLIRQSDNASETFHDLKTIEKHVRNCKTIVEDLLHFARSSPPQETIIRIDEAMDDVLQFVRQHAELEQIEVIRKYDANVPKMLLDEEKIKQVFMNLIMNARHAIGDAGVLTIGTAYHRKRSAVEIHISDDGYGIDKHNLSRIFDPFFTTKPTGEGTGLGLSVSYGIVKNHGGDIRVESVPGQGSTFTIVLPVIPPNPMTESIVDGKIAADR